MPYSSNIELPASIRSHLPSHAQSIFVKAFNSAYAEYGNEEQAFKVAWAAVKKVYEKNEATGKWVLKS
ncbi:MAG TPA: ChaB family protein [Candidatus Saccharimonadales bacterium]|nr:ChaB family protein [Candidatus Saccharimonadales bacterium]